MLVDTLPASSPHPVSPNIFPPILSPSFFFFYLSPFFSLSALHPTCLHSPLCPGLLCPSSSPFFSHLCLYFINFFLSSVYLATLLLTHSQPLSSFANCCLSCDLDILCDLLLCPICVSPHLHLPPLTSSLHFLIRSCVLFTFFPLFLELYTLWEVCFCMCVCLLMCLHVTSQ